MSHSQHEAPAARDITAAAGKLGRDAGKAAASWIFDGSTYQAPGLSAATGYTETDLADDLVIDGGDEALAGAVTAYLDTATACGECRKAGCEPGRSGSYPDCQRDDMDDL